MKIYMDACCFNRPFDDSTQDRIELEAEVVLTVLERCQNGKWELAGSEILEMELGRCPEHEKRMKMWALYSNMKNHLTVTPKVEERSKFFQHNGIKSLDSLHLALAEIYRQNVFLTTDDALIAASRRIKPAVVVSNPIPWFMEAMHNGY